MGFFLKMIYWLFKICKVLSVGLDLLMWVYDLNKIKIGCVYIMGRMN